MRIAHVCVHARRFCRSSGLRRAARRTSSIAVKALAFSLAPTLLTDLAFDHARLSSSLFEHESAMVVVNALVTTGIIDLYLLLRR